MSRDTEITMQMASTLCIQESVGRWDNSITYLDDVNNKTICPYTIQVFADYPHAFYHIGVGITSLLQGFEHQSKYIRTTARQIALDISKTKLNNIPLHFSGIVFIGADKISIDPQTLTQEFQNNGMEIRVYNTSSFEMPAVIPRIILTSANKYSGKFQEDSEILYESPDYIVWCEKDGAVSYALQMRLSERFQDVNTVLSDLSQLSPYREKVTQYIHSKSDRKKISSSMASALKDGLEGKIEDAIKTLEILEKNRLEALSIKRRLLQF